MEAIFNVQGEQMERFLEIILETEKEAAAIEEDASAELAEIERDYCLSLARLEAQSLKEVYKKLQKERQAHVKEIEALGEKIHKENQEQCSLIQEAAGRIEEEGMKLVVNTLLPDGE